MTEPKPRALKPEFLVDIAAPVAPSLRIADLLSHLKPGSSYHEKLDCRHPLGIYNVSTSRIFKKLQKCSQKLEAYLHAAPHVIDLSKYVDIQQELIDYLELCLYAAAEHVDDTDSIANCFYIDDTAYAKSPAVRELKNEIKPVRDRIAAFTNAIKHRQSRIRLFSCDFAQRDGEICLHGFFIEQFHNGGVAPSPIFHADGERIISITSFLWSVLFYLNSMSEALCEFLAAIDAVGDEVEVQKQASMLKECVVGLLRLPLYSFDDAHPFEKTRFVVKFDKSQRPEMESNLYGSFTRRWSKSPFASFGQVTSSYEGDGTTRTFHLNAAGNVRIQHWD
jgi:hypothetical protein